MQGDPPFLTVHAASAFLGVHPSTIRRWAHEQKLPGTRPGPRGDWRFPREAVQRLVRNESAPGAPSESAEGAASRQHTCPRSVMSPAQILGGGGEMDLLMGEMDWSSTPLGGLEEWPESLRTLVATALRSSFPIVIWWDRCHYTMLYNDAYIPILSKKKHPGALGRSGQECWKEIWSIIGPMMEGVFATGQPTWSEDLLLVMDRNLPLEETYFTFSYSAIPGEKGVDGVFCACTETTERVLSERRLRTLRDLASRASEARSAEEACEIAAQLLSQNDTDIPFALIYLLDRERTTAHLAALSGLEPLCRAAVPAIMLNQPPERGIWPLASVAREAKPQLVNPLADHFGALPGGPWPESPDSALVLPLIAPDQHQVTGFLVVGVNPRRLLDEPYRDFFTLVAGHVATAVANARAYEEERHRAEALAELDRAKTAFFSNISHEFRTPLTLMLGPIEEALAENGTLSPGDRERTELLRRNAMRLLKLVNTLLEFSRIEAGRIQASYAPSDLSALTTDLASSFRSAIERAGMHLIVDCPVLTEPVYVDQDMWEKIVLNLLSNACKYTFHGTIRVTLRQTPGEIQCAVQDTGVGIPAAELPHMFERFHRVQGTQGRTFEGTGIGLSFVQELVKLHGGTIRVQSTLGKGSTFTVTLPLGKAHLPPERLVTPRARATTPGNAQLYVEEAFQLLAGEEAASETLLAVPHTVLGEPPSRFTAKACTGAEMPAARILFADDNADMRAYVRRLMHQHYDVHTVPDGEAALAVVEEDPPDLVLADVMMPGKDGFALLHALRSNPATRTVPVILLSARAGEEASIEGMQAGADDYLIKPFSARELLARVSAHLEMAHLRKAAEERIKAEQQRLHALLMQAPAAIAFLRGPDHVFEFVNTCYVNSHGPGRAFLGKPAREALSEVAGQGYFELLDRAYQTGEPVIEQEALIRIDSCGDGTLRERYFDYVYQPARTATGEVEGILFHGVDITEQMKAREQIRASEARFRTLAEQVPHLVWMAHPDGARYWYNARWYEYTGTTPEQVKGWGWQAVYDPELLPVALQGWDRARQNGGPWEIVVPLRGADGLLRPFLTRIVPVRDAQGTVVQWVGTSTDITEQKKLEQQKDEFLGIASHELKTPLTSLKGYAQLLENRFKQAGDAASAALLQKMDAQINKLTGLVGDLLDMTRIESGHLRLRPSSFAFNELIQEVTEETRRTTANHIIVLDLAPPVTLRADRDRIGQVLTNLLTNAIKYAPQSSSIIVKTVQREGMVLTSVQDFGMGIPREKQAHLFERFFRVEGEIQATYPGLGLGLYISAEFVKRHHGDIWVQSDQGQGTTMTFSLPLDQHPLQ